MSVRGDLANDDSSAVVQEVVRLLLVPPVLGHLRLLAHRDQIGMHTDCVQQRFHNHVEQIVSIPISIREECSEGV